MNSYQEELWVTLPLFVYRGRPSDASLGNKGKLEAYNSRGISEGDVHSAAVSTYLQQIPTPDHFRKSGPRNLSLWSILTVKLI